MERTDRGVLKIKGLPAVWIVTVKAFAAEPAPNNHYQITDS